MGEHERSTGDVVAPLDLERQIDALGEDIDAAITRAVAEGREAGLREAAAYVEREAGGRWRGSQSALCAVAERIRGLR